MAPAFFMIFMLASVTIDIYVAFSIPFLFPSLNSEIVKITFTNATLESSDTFPHSNPNETFFNGHVNSVTVQNLTDLHLGLWAACITEVGLDGINNSTCFPASFGSGYSVVLENTASNIAVTIAQPPLTGLLMVEALAGLVTLAATFTSSHDKHIYIMVLAIILTLASFIIDAVLFTSVEKIVPIFGSQVQSSLGAGFFWTVVSFVSLLIAVGLLRIL